MKKIDNIASEIWVAIQDLGEIRSELLYLNDENVPAVEKEKSMEVQMKALKRVSSNLSCLRGEMWSAYLDIQAKGHESDTRLETD